MKNQLLLLSGFEANGFAGLVADVRVAQALETGAAAIPTAMTAQSAKEMRSAEPVHVSLLSQQLATLIAVPDVIKIGLIPSREVAEIIRAWLHKTYRDTTHRPFVVLDPVAHSSSGHDSLIQGRLIDAIKPLLPWVSLITPNTEELRLMANMPETDLGVSETDLLDYFQIQFPTFQGAILVKGGHRRSNRCEVEDRLYKFALGEEIECMGSWVQSRVAIQARGTGCALSTAIACASLQGYELKDAVTVANAWVHRILAYLEDHNIKQGAISELSPALSGWSYEEKHYAHIERNISTKQKPRVKPSLNFPRMNHSDGLYPVVDSSQWVERLGAIGIQTIQLRIKHGSRQHIFNEVERSVKIANRYNVQLFINDHWQEAIECRAFGVHLGQEDLERADLGAISLAGLRLGISTHGDYEFLSVKPLNPSYLAVGAVFPTQTKDMSGQIQGLSRLKRYTQMAQDIPVVAIGGINLSNINDVLDCHPDMVAVVSAITRANDPEASTLKLMSAMAQRKTRFNHRWHADKPIDKGLIYV